MSEPGPQTCFRASMLTAGGGAQGGATIGLRAFRSPGSARWGRRSMPRSSTSAHSMPGSRLPTTGRTSWRRSISRQFSSLCSRSTKPTPPIAATGKACEPRYRGRCGAPGDEDRKRALRPGSHRFPERPGRGAAAIRSGSSSAPTSSGLRATASLALYKALGGGWPPNEVIPPIRHPDPAAIAAVKHLIQDPPHPQPPPPPPGLTP